MDAKGLIAPIVVIAVGATLFLNVLHILPGVDWLWTLGLALAGVIVLVVQGLNTRSVVVGPFLILASICALLRQVGAFTFELELPILVMLLGVLMFLPKVIDLPQAKPLFPPENEGK